MVFLDKVIPRLPSGVRGIFTKLLFNFGAVEESDCNPEEEKEVSKGYDGCQVQV